MIDLSDRTHCFYWQTDRALTPKEYDRIFLHRHDVSTSTIIDVLKCGITTIPHIHSLEAITPDENILKGNVNIVRKVSINGSNYVVRMHPRGVKNGYFYVEQLALAQAAIAGVPVPEILEVHEANDENDMDFVLMTASAGMTMDILLEQDQSPEDKLLIDCGRLMAKIHTVNVEGFGPFDNNIAKREKRLLGLHNTYNDFIHTGLHENLERLVTYKILTQHQTSLLCNVFDTHAFEPAGGPRLIHNDFADWNLLTDTKNITAVLDWDECHAGDPVADLACWSTFFSIERMKKFMEGYSAHTTLPKDYDERFHFYRLRYTISKMALRIKRYQVDKSPFILEKLKVGKLALEEESKWFSP